MNTDDLMEKPYSEIHFAEVELVNTKADTTTYESVRGRVVGRQQGQRSNKAGYANRLESIDDTLTIRKDDWHKDVKVKNWRLVDFEPCDDVEAVKAEWSE